LIIIHDAFLNREKTGPLHVAEYSALLMNITEGRCYGTGEIARYLSEAGFDWVDHQPTAVARSFIVARKP
jgi:acetylserotonin N-methyltransferase